MTTKDVTLRPGDSISLKLELGGQALRLDLSLTPEGIEASGPVPVGAPTVFGGVPPLPQDHPVVEHEDVLDLTDEFAAEDAARASDPQAQPISLAAVEPYDTGLDEAPQAVDVPFEEIDDEPTAVEYSGGDDDIDLDLGDLTDDADDDLGGLGDDEGAVESVVDIPDDDGGFDLSLDDDDSMQGGVDIPGEDEGLGSGLEDDDGLSIDIPDDATDDGGMDFSFDDNVDDAAPGPGPVDIPDDSYDDGLSIDIPDDSPADEPLDIAPDDDFSADGATMIPPTRNDAAPQPGDKGFIPNPDDTLPVWTGKARTYRDPDVERKKKETAKLEKQPAKPAPAAPAPAGPGKAKLPAAAKKPVTKQMKKPTGQVAAPKLPGKPAPAAKAAAEGNFTVFLSPPKGADKKQAAAEIIAEIQGIDLNEAMTLAGKMIVPVAKGVTENDANGIRDRFKSAGLSCRITQKR